MYALSHLIEVLSLIALLSTTFTWLQYQFTYKRIQRKGLLSVKTPLTKGRKLDEHTKNLYVIQAMLDDDPMLESTLRSLLGRRYRGLIWIHIIETFAVNALSVIAGWLLSALIDPKTLLPFLGHL